MKDFQEIPQKAKEEYGLFLIRHINGLDTAILDSILKQAGQDGSIVSIERLFKGNLTTLTIFGPKTVLTKFNDNLGLLELEDYVANLDSKHISTWEIGMKDAAQFSPKDINNIFNSLPKLGKEDQFFWQVVLGRDQSQIRAALYSQDAKKHKTWVPGKFTKVPRPFSAEQMMDFYKLRTVSRDSKIPVLTPESIMQLLKV
ncbi:hypothetical protein HYU94_03855 [Candidatus Daviesbacteria bacterium]|nr:hypothetical protein [Candidatus Daviesbacteria bacterium]